MPRLDYRDVLHGLEFAHRFCFEFRQEPVRTDLTQEPHDFRLAALNVHLMGVALID